MKRLLKKLRTWHSQSKLRSLARWERTRAKGKARFLWRSALTYSSLMIPTRGFVTYLFDGEMQSWQSGDFWADTIWYSITGAVIGLVSWATLEGQYKNALLERRIAAAMPPVSHDSALPERPNPHTPALPFK